MRNNGIDLDELDRLEALKRYNILDTPPDGTFNNITALAAEIFQVPISIVSLVDEDRIWFKSHHGLNIDQVERAPGLCASAILGDVPYIVTDARLDARTLANPLVAGELGLKFYAGVPLITRDHYRLGTLCVIDKEPREVTQEEIQNLKRLAQTVMDQMELRLEARKIAELNVELKLAGELLAEKAHKDHLTGLMNRGCVLESLEIMLARAKRETQPLSVLLLDVDDFKTINDTYGHAAGDDVLIEVATRLQQAYRKCEYLGRIGGEEFLMVLYPCDSTKASLVAERVLSAIRSQPFTLQAYNRQIPVTASLGIGYTNHDPEFSMKQLLAQADRALYQVKNNGKDGLSS